MRIFPDKFYSPDAPEMAAIGAEQTLARWRSEGRGPKYIKAARRIFYRGSDVLDFLKSNLIETNSTT